MTEVKNTIAGLNLPSSIRVEYGGLYQEQQKSFGDLLMVLFLALLLLFAVLLFEFRTFSAPDGDPGLRFTLELWRICGAPRHPNHVQRRVFHGHDHGHWHRRQERHPAS